MTIKVVADTKLCSGHARCAAVARDVFTLDDNGFIGFTEKEIPPEQVGLARRGVRACPERALMLLGDDAAETRHSA